MKMKNIDLVIILNDLYSLAQKRLPQKISYAMAKNNMLLGNEYSVYIKEIEKLNNEYDEYIIKDKEGNPELNENSLPKVKPEVEQEYYTKINELINIEIEVDLYQIDEECFDYDDAEGKYDSLTLAEQMMLRSLLVKK